MRQDGHSISANVIYLEMCQNKHLTEHGTATENSIKTNKKCPFLNFCGGFTYFILFYKMEPRSSLRFSSVQSLSHVQLFVIPCIAARQASLSITNSWRSLRLMSIESVMPSSHLIFCCPLLLLLSILPSNQGLFQCVSSSHQVNKVLEL